MCLYCRQVVLSIKGLIQGDEEVRQVCLGLSLIGILGWGYVNNTIFQTKLKYLSSMVLM
jgi:hypothetical protein